VAQAALTSVHVSFFLDELETVSEGIESVEALVALELCIVDDLDAGVLKALPQRMEALHAKGRVRLPCWSEV
jgi:hypothetical protein